MNPYDDFDFDDICVGPEDIFESLSEAEQVVERAKHELYDLLKADIKNTLQEAVAAKKELTKLHNEVASTRYEAGKWKKKIEQEKARFEQAKDFEIPKMYLDRIVRNYTGGLAPGDTVYVIEKENQYEICPKCKGAKKVEAILDGETVPVSCPVCDGRGKISVLFPPKVAEKKVTGVYLKLCFENGRVGIWNTDNVFLDKSDWGEDPKKIYRTQQEAQEALKGDQDGKDHH